MVTFTCMGCNESLRKPAVAKHKRRCRNCYTLSCIDCGRDFHGEEYAMHTSCISEAERYQGALYQTPSKKKQKMNPQERWMAALLHVSQGSAIKSESIAVQAAFKKLALGDNVPRKCTKFCNYCKNTYRSLRVDDLKHMFDLIDKRKNQMLEEEAIAAKKVEESEYLASKRKAGDGLGCQKSKKRIRWRKSCREVLELNDNLTLHELQVGVISLARKVYGTSGALTGFSDGMINRIVEAKTGKSRHFVCVGDKFSLKKKTKSRN